jgi:hypothetical protein
MAAFASPYIKTEASQVTRVADSAVMTGVNFSSWFNPSEGTLFVDAQSNGLLSVGPIAMEVSDGTLFERIFTGQFIAGAVRSMFVQAGNVNQVTIQNTVSPVGYVKASGSYKFNDFLGTVNGGTVQTDTSGVLPTVNRLQIGAASGNVTQFLNGYIKRLTYYNRSLTSAELQAITR